MDGDFKIAPWRGPPALLNQRVCRLSVANHHYAKGLLAPVLQGYLDAINAKTPSITVKHLSSRTIGEIPLPLPPRAEQDALVEAIDSHLSRLDVAAASLGRAQAKLRAYRASVLKAAVEGRLVPTEAELARKEKRDYEPADVLLRRILAERRRRWERAELAKLTAAGKPPKDDKWKAKYDEPTPPDTSGLPELPEGWCWTTAAALYWDAGYGTSEKCTLDGAGVPVLRIPNVQGGRITLEDMKYASPDAELAAEGAVEEGDFLFIRTNGSPSLIGRGALVDRQHSNLYFASYLIRLRLVRVEDVPRWLGLAWHAAPIRNQLLKVAVSSAGQHNVSLSSASEFAVPLPPAAEQSRILLELERVDTAAAATLSQIAADSRRVARLRQSVLKWAFEGKLVDQDPNDEPAEKLLTRIRADRLATPIPAKQVRRMKKTTKRRDSRVPRDLGDTLREHTGPMAPEALLQAAGYDHSNLDAFFRALRHAVRSGQIRELRKRPREVLLTLASR
jgi:type I restriction enzyme S subunit